MLKNFSWIANMTILTLQKLMRSLKNALLISDKIILILFR